MIELLLLFALVLVGGVLAGAEMALVTARRGRLEQAADAGSMRAKAALRLRRNPERFLATMQIGIWLLLGVRFDWYLLVLLFWIPWSAITGRLRAVGGKIA